jgi:hypothetical protein
VLSWGRRANLLLFRGNYDRTNRNNYHRLASHVGWRGNDDAGHDDTTR